MLGRGGRMRLGGGACWVGGEGDEARGGACWVGEGG